jgi:hypothetical protein
MLARKLKLTLNGLEVGTTPMLVPSVSSRTNIDISDILTVITETVSGPILISAYDWYYYKKKFKTELNLTFPNLIFLDSGGYECNKDKDLSDIGLYKPDSHDWDEKLYLQVIKQWSTKIPTVLISLDIPSDRKPTEDQIKEAGNLFKGKKNFLKEILIKPQSKSSERINKEDIIRNLKSLSKFDILGFTEKELGFSLLDRMTNLAKIRMAMDDERIEKPIHIFGSLDPITTPLYYMAGADIFDGLSWLRFVFHKGQTYYIDSCGPRRFGIHENVRARWGKNVGCNYTYLMRLQLDLEKFQSKEDFKIFESNANFFKKAFDDLSEKIGGRS